MSLPDWRRHAVSALSEDRVDEDVTTALLGDRARRPATGTFRAEGDFVLAGLPMVEAVFRELDASSAVDGLVAEGDRVVRGTRFAEVRAPAGKLLGGERVALNFLQRLCGIATAARRAVDAIAGTNCVITDTRKTTPGLRELEKYAVRVGGGISHRASLADAVLWKDNHWALLGEDALEETLRLAPRDVSICVEVESDEQLDQALQAGVTWILADNQPPDVIRRWVDRVGSDVTIEASGGITPATVGEYARAGAARISMGELTRVPDPVSISFELDSTGG